MIFPKLHQDPMVYPQSSILGPILFLVYVSDMTQNLECHLFSFTDDSCFVREHKDVNEFEKKSLN